MSMTLLVCDKSCRSSPDKLIGNLGLLSALKMHGCCNFRGSMYPLKNFEPPKFYLRGYMYPKKISMGTLGIFNIAHCIPQTQYKRTGHLYTGTLQMFILEICCLG